MHELEHTHGSEQERCGEGRAEERDARVAGGDVAQHPRDDAQPLERGPVRRHRALEAGSAGDVREGAGGHGLPRALLETRSHGDHGRLSPGSREVDLLLPPLADALHGLSLDGPEGRLTRA